MTTEHADSALPGPHAQLSIAGLLALCLLGGLSLTPRAEDAPQPAAKQGDAAPSLRDSPKSDSGKGEAAKTDSAKVEAKREVLSGRVVFLLDALKKRDIKAYDAEMKGQLVLETRTGELWPILSDWRGRAFYQDERLRNRPVDLLVLRDTGSPYLRVQSIYTFDDKGARQLTDYWCDVCSIPMYEIKECECCQGPIRLRYRKKSLPPEFAPLEK